MKAYIVDKQALKNNLEILKSRAGSTAIWGVVKGDGYGMGCVNMASFLHENGIRRFAVTEISEVRALRTAGFEDVPILMMEGTCNPIEVRELLQLGAIFSVGTGEDAAVINAEAAALGMKAQAHVKIDTGMGRYGFLHDQTEQIAALYTDYPNMELTGIYTHFHSARNASVTQNQFDRFQRVVSALRQAGFDPGMVHCCNSTAFWKYEHMHCDAVRVGSAVLGRVNFEGKTGLQKVGFCQAELEEIRTIPAGHSVGYGAGWKAKKDTRIAVLSVGYINGFSVDRGFDLWRFSDCLRGIGRYIKAFLKKKALYVRVKGKACRVLGHVGMVNMVIDVTGCDCQPGDLAHVDINPLLVRNMEIVFQ
jgi:alanine racemase